MDGTVPVPPEDLRGGAGGGLDAGADDYLRNEGIELDHAAVHERIRACDVGAEPKNLAVHVGYLRREPAAAGAPPLIDAVRGAGDTVRRS